MSAKRRRILVVGQTPPPFGGQAVMIKAMLAGEYEGVELKHVRMSFSDDMDSIGRFQVKKIWVLFTTIFKIWVARVRWGTRVLYYPPAGPNTVPVLRDIILLTATRWMFAHTIFHFHAGGVSTFRASLPAPFRPLFNIAYRKPTLALRTSALNPDDGAELGAKNSIVVPNGIRDMSKAYEGEFANAGERQMILFTGVLIPSKGVWQVLEAFKIVVDSGVDAGLWLMGRWGDAEYEKKCNSFINENGLKERVVQLGVVPDPQKFEYFSTCDVFCFPSYFEAESFGLVLVEAMQFNKPVVSTHWRGIPSVVQDGRNGFLVPIKAQEQVAEKLTLLLNDPDLKMKMGQEGRRIFEEKFSLNRFYRNMEDAFHSLH